MGDTRKPTEATRDGDAVTTEAGESASETESDLQAKLADAEAEAAEAEAAGLPHGPTRRDAIATTRQPRRRGRGWRTRQAPTRLCPQFTRRREIVAAIVIVGSLAGSGTIVWQHHTAAVRRQHAEQFIDAAKQGVVAVTSIDFNAVRDQVQHIIDNSTGAFREDFIARSAQFIQVAQASKAVAKGTVTAAAVESMKTDEAVVLLVGSEQISNAAGNQQPRSFRFRVTVTRDADQLKVSKLELVL